MKKLTLLTAFLMLVTTFFTADILSAKTHSKWKNRNIPANLRIKIIDTFDWDYKCGHLKHLDHTKRNKKLVKKVKRKSKILKRNSNKRYGDYQPRQGCGWERYYSDYEIDDAKAYAENKGQDETTSINWIFKKDL